MVPCAQDPDPEPVCCGIPGIMKPGGNMGICMPLGRFGKLKLKLGNEAGAVVFALALSLEVSRSWSSVNRGRSLGRFDPWLPPREDCGPRLPPWSVAMRRLIAVKRRRMRVRTMHHCE